MGTSKTTVRKWRFARIAEAFRGRDWFGVGVEVFAVVLGVVLALQASQWGDNRREAQEREALIERLVIDLEGFSRDYDARARYREESIASLRRVATHLEAGTLNELTDQQLVDDLESIRSFGDLRPLPLSYQEMTGAGLIGSLEDREDREALESLSRLMSQYQVMFDILIEAYPPSDPLYDRILYHSAAQILGADSGASTVDEGLQINRQFLEGEQFKDLLIGAAQRIGFQRNYDESLAQRARDVIAALER